MATAGEAKGEAVILPPAGVARSLAIAAAGTIAVGLLTKRRDLVRAGVRLGAVQLAAAAVDAAVRRIDTSGSEVAAPPPVVVEAMATWLAETLVAAAFDRFDPDNRVVDGRPAPSRSAKR